MNTLPVVYKRVHVVIPTPYTDPVVTKIDDKFIGGRPDFYEMLDALGAKGWFLNGILSEGPSKQVVIFSKRQQNKPD